ncbi:MAG: sulfatase-like hydrolase/transferase [Kiritimatiellales bacterium]
MSENDRLKFTIAGLLSGAVAALAEPAGSKPNVLFIVADDLGYGDLACYGNPYIDTPVIDRLAQNGIRFTACYSPSPLCAPARAGLLTGRYNHRTGAIDVSSNRGIDRMALSEKTFGDYFKSAGYATALIGKWHNGLYCNDYLPHKRGFDLFYGFANGEQDYWNWNLNRNDVIEKYDGRYMTDVFNQEAEAFIRDCAQNKKPFALFLAHHVPHEPLQAPERLIEKYKQLGRGTDAVATIYAMIEQMDAGLGQVFQTLETCGITENTIIVFTSDNGAQLDGRQQRYHAGFQGNKGNVLEQGIRVPGIVSWPGKIPAGKVVPDPVHGCDWLPTLFSLTGAPPPAGAKPFDGRNIMPLLQTGIFSEHEDRPLCFQKNRYTPVAHSDASIRRGKWKLYWPGEKTTMEKDIGRDNPSFERGGVMLPWEMPIDPDLPDYSGVKMEATKLFDLEQDPGETTDCSAAHPEIVQDLARIYDAWFADVSKDWKNSSREIIAHDKQYWANRKIPDPGVLFKDFWQWKRCPGTNPKTDDPLKVFTGYWNYKEKRQVTP